MLMIAHIDFNVAVRNPSDGGFEIGLAVHFARDIFAGQAVSGAVVFTEIALGITHPRARIHGVAQLLLGEFLASDVDGLEPLEFLTVGAATDIHLQGIVEDLFLLIGL